MATQQAAGLAGAVVMVTLESPSGATGGWPGAADAAELASVELDVVLVRELERG
jgi:hypothetical protein